MLVLLIFVSIAQDILWLMLNRDTEDDDDDGGVERSVKSFSRKMSYVSLIWRVLLSIVLWKDSLDFVAIVKDKGSGDQATMGLEHRV